MQTILIFLPSQSTAGNSNEDLSNPVDGNVYRVKSSRHNLLMSDLGIDNIAQY